MRALSSLFWIFLWLLGISILLSFVLRWWTGDSIPFVRRIGYIMPWLLVLLVPGVLIALLSKYNLLAVILSIPTFIICISYSPLFLNCLQVADANSPTIKVMSYNIWKNNRNPAAAAELIRREQPDILLLQEIRTDKFQDLLKNINGLVCRYTYAVRSRT